MLPLHTAVILFVVGYGCIWFGADTLVDNIRAVAKAWNVPGFLIGLLILGIDAEESISSIVAASNGLPYIAIGNVIGNTAIALTLCFGLPAIIYSNTLKIKYSSNNGISNENLTNPNNDNATPRDNDDNAYYNSISNINNSLENCHFITIIICELLILTPYFINSLADNLIASSILTISFFIIYIGANIWAFIKLDRKTSEMVVDLELSDISIDSNDKELEEQNDIMEKDNDRTNTFSSGEKAKFFVKKFTMIILALLISIVGGELLIYASINILKQTNVINESFFGTIIIAFVTNMEEVTLIIVAACKGSSEIGIAGMIGKTVWNVTLTFGISGLILTRIEYQFIDIMNIFFLFFITIYWSVLIKFRALDRMHGILLLCLFVVFVFVNCGATFSI